MSRSSKTYVVDIDETICRTPYDPVLKRRDYGKSEPISERIETINRLFDEGHTIIYWTARGASTGDNWFRTTYVQLQMWGCKFTELRMGKPSYDYFICDKAINAEDYFRED